MAVEGLLLQLNSMPVQILGAEWCFNECPSLRAEQRNAVLVEMRELSACLAPEVKQATPLEIFERNASMNAAYVLWWGELSGET